MNISFIPEVCKGETATFEGTLVLRLPSAEERCEYMAEANIDFKDMASSDNTRSLKPIALMMRKSYDHIIKVDLKKKADGKKITSVDELRFDPDCFQILTELAGKMMSGGFVLGKN